MGHVGMFFFSVAKKEGWISKLHLFAFRLNKQLEQFMEVDSSYMLRLGGFFILGDSLSCFFFSNLPQLPSNVSQNGNAPPLNKNDIKRPCAMSFASKNESFSKIILFKTAKMNRCGDPRRGLKGMFILIFLGGIQSCPGEPTPEGTLG